MRAVSRELGNKRRKKEVLAAVEKAAAVLEASTERASPAYVTYSFFFFDKKKVGKRKKKHNMASWRAILFRTKTCRGRFASWELNRTFSTDSHYSYIIRAIASGRKSNERKDESINVKFRRRKTKTVERFCLCWPSFSSNLTRGTG